MVYTMLSPLRSTQSVENAEASDTRIAATSDRSTDSKASCSENDDSNSEATAITELPLLLFDEKNECINLSVGKEKTIKIASSSESIVVYIDWSQKLLENYDTHYLENLPEVFKYGPVTKKARNEPLSLYTCLEAFLREEPLVPEDMWLDLLPSLSFSVHI